MSKVKSDTKRVRFLVSVMSARESFSGGQVYTLPAARAEEYVAQGVAVLIEISRSHASTSARGAGEERAIDHWRHAVRPGDAYDWQVKVKLPLLAKPFIRYARVGSRLRARKPKRRQYLDEVGGFGREIRAPQACALTYLLERETAVCAKVLHALALDAKNFRADWEAQGGLAVADAVVPRGMTAAELVERIRFTRVGVSSRARAGVAYLEIGGDCLWDPDHGFNVVLHRNRVVGVWQQGAGWTDPVAKKGRSVKRGPVPRTRTP